MTGIELARKHGLDVGCICTFTARSQPRAAEIYDFFLREALNFSIHIAVPSLRCQNAHGWPLSPEARGQLMLDLFDRYLSNLDRIRISTLDSMCRSVASGRGGICTFGDCLGAYLAVGPDGAIYPCQRFAGMAEYRVGTVHDCPSMDGIASSRVWRILQTRQERIAEACQGCAHVDICRGGCPYNALAASAGGLSIFENPSSLRDPHCPSYRRFFSHIVDRATQEVFSEDNLEEVVGRVDTRRGLFRRGPLLSIMRDGPHPQETAQHAWRILAAVVLAATGSASEAARKLAAVGLWGGCTGTYHPERSGESSQLRRSEATLRHYQEQLNAPIQELNNLYLHVTFDCNLRCTHCYAQAGPPRQGMLSVEDIARLCYEAAKQGFYKGVITGGEPLIHPQREVLMEALAHLRSRVKPMLTTLRTSLALPLSGALLEQVASSTDQVVVSVDGDRETHDARRGAGSYDVTLKNLFSLANKDGTAEISLAAVLSLAQINNRPGDAVRVLASKLGIRRVQFRPVLPLGRAVESDLDIVPDALWAHLDPREMVEYGIAPKASCGMGQNLYVEPDGSTYPCYAWHGAQWRLGNVNQKDGLASVIASAAFRDLSKHTVATNRRCRNCALRYLCGGACRAWSRQPDSAQTDLDAPPVDCSPLHRRAYSLLSSALEQLKISSEQWLAAGLPLPTSGPPEAFG
jgi:uncharacterized protein